jgi:hypothetical protein
MIYSENMSAEDKKKLLEECEAEDRMRAEAGDTSGTSEENDLERGYTMDRISRNPK